MEYWTIEETELLVKLYTKDELELLPICRIMRKKCKVIINKLLELGIVLSKNQVRGSLTKHVLQETNTKDQTISSVAILSNVNLIVNELSNIYQSYLKIINHVNQTFPSNPSK